MKYHEVQLKLGNVEIIILPVSKLFRKRWIVLYFFESMVSKINIGMISKWSATLEEIIFRMTR